MIEELIEAGEYGEALGLLNDLSDEHVRYLRLVCLVGLGEYHRAKVEGSQAKAQASESYYDVVSMYVTALKELGEYEEAIEILIQELSMPYIPYQYESVFNAAYDEVLLEKQEHNYELESKNQIFSVEEIEQVLKNKSGNEELLFMALDQLQQLNIRMILPTVRDYLMDEHGHFFIKTLLLEILIDQDVDDDFEVYKFGNIYDVNPALMSLVLEKEDYQGIAHYLQNTLEDDNPTLFEQCMDYLEFMLYSFYPKEIYEDEYALKAAAIHYYVATLQNIEIDMDDLEMSYYCDCHDLEHELNVLRQIEI